MPRDMSSLAIPSHPETSDARAAMTELIPSLSARALRLCRSRADADDLVQETVLRALRFEATFEPGTNARAWMFRILDSVFVSRMRSRTRERRALERFVNDPNLTSRSSAPLPLASVSTHMDSALRALPHKFFEVVKLVDVHEHSYREAAAELGVPVGTVMSRLFRARRLLQGVLTEGSTDAVARAA